MIIVKLQGGMGNQMFQYALGRSVSLKLGVPLKLDLSSFSEHNPAIIKREFDLSVFNIHAEKASWLEKFFAKDSKESSYRFDPKTLAVGDNTHLDGYWQSWKYFEDIKDVVQSDFTLKDAIPEAVAALKQELAGVESVCINVRRADFVHHAKNKKFHGSLDVDYFDAAVALIRQKVSTPKFFVFSDDLPWCQENIAPRYNARLVPHSLAGDKFQWYLELLSSCRHQIIPNSSFGWWGAWRNRNPSKIIIAPKKWTNDPGLDSSDLTPPEWIRI